jgi:hypothetical protein
MMVKTTSWNMDNGEAVVVLTDGDATELDEEENGVDASGSSDLHERRGER